MEYLESPFVVFVFIELTIITIGLVGNSLCLMVFFQKEMRSSYNYLLMGLTISDAMCLILSFLWCLDNLNLINLNGSNFNLHELDFVQGFVFIWDWICKIVVEIISIKVNQH